jgi:hypothetical protein
MEFWRTEECLVIASEAKQSLEVQIRYKRLLRRCALRNDIIGRTGLKIRFYTINAVAAKN